MWWRLATGRHAPLRSLNRVARPSSPRAPCARGNFLASAVCRVRCARSRVVVAIATARRPCPLPPPPVPPPLRSLCSLSGGGCNAPSMFLLRSARAVARGSVRPLLPAPYPAHPCRKVAPPLRPRSAAQSPRALVGRRVGAPRPPSSLLPIPFIPLNYHFFRHIKKKSYLCSRILTPKSTKKWLKFMVSSAP